MALLLLPLWLLPLTGGSQRAEPMFTAVTNSVLPPDYDSNPTQLNYGVAVTDVDHDGDFEIVVAGSLVLAIDSIDFAHVAAIVSGFGLTTLPPWCDASLQAQEQRASR
ncbi:cartilage acidic protein 1 isoform 2 [Cricetulus griseus]|nr:cartilage acidic protein 1 isoform 2 [Cricetulus griseus]